MHLGQRSPNPSINNTSAVVTLQCIAQGLHHIAVYCTIAVMNSIWFRLAYHTAWSARPMTERSFQPAKVLIIEPGCGCAVGVMIDTRLRNGESAACLKAGKLPDTASAADLGSGDSNGLGNIKEGHGRLDAVGVDVQGPPCDCVSEALGVREVLSLKGLVPFVQGVVPLFTHRLVPAQGKKG